MRLRRHNIIGDLLYLRGKSVRKWRDGDHALVELGLEARNQNDELSADGSAIVRLPARHATQ